jgi:hypothetical protein
MAIGSGGQGFGFDLLNSPGYSGAIIRRLMGLQGGSNPTTGTAGVDPATGVSNNLAGLFQGAIGADGSPNIDVNSIMPSPLNSVSPTPGVNNTPGLIGPTQTPTASLIKSPTGNYRRTGTPPVRKKPNMPMVKGTASVSPGEGRSTAINARLSGLLANKQKQPRGGY